MILFLVSLFVSDTVNAETRVRVLPEYCFDSGGRIVLEIDSPRKDGVKFHLLPLPAMNLVIGSGSIDGFCSKAIDSLWPAVPPANERELTWRLIMRMNGTFVPVITNCYELNLTFKIRYSNPGNLLDKREQFIPRFYDLLFILYVCVSVTWFINGLRFPMLRISLHKSFSIFAILKTVVVFLYARIWHLKVVTDDLNSMVWWSVVLSNTGVHALLTALNVLACMGWGTLYRKMKPSENFGCGMIGVVLWVSILAIEHVSPWFIFSAGYYAIVMLLRICKCLFDARVYQAFDYDDAMHFKFYHMHEFCWFLLSYSLVAVFLSLFVVCSYNRTGARIVLLELGILGMIILDMMFWLLRQEFVPSSEIDTEMQFEIGPDLMEIEDPNGKQLAIICPDL